MDRRGMLATMFGLGAVAAANAGANVKVVAKDTASEGPMMFVVEHPGRMSVEARANFRKQWEAIWQGKPPAPIVVLQEGAKMVPVYRQLPKEV